MAIASTALRNSAELGLTTSVFFARFVAMRRVEEGIRESIPAAVKHVYRVHLTIPGELSLRSVTHLHRLPKTLTSSALPQAAGIVARRGIRKIDIIQARRRTGGFSSRIDSP